MALNFSELSGSFLNSVKEEEKSEKGQLRNIEENYSESSYTA